MRKLFLVLIIIGFAATANAGLMDAIQGAAKDAVGQAAPKPAVPDAAAAKDAVTGGQAVQAPEPIKAAAPSLSPDQQDANTCTQFTHEDYLKAKAALETTTLKRGTGRYLAKQEWINYLKGRYSNMRQTPDGFTYNFGKWHGTSCSDAVLTCPKSEPGCNLQVKCYDFATRKNIKTCPINVCDFNDAKCNEKYKPGK